MSVEKVVDDVSRTRHRFYEYDNEDPWHVRLVLWSGRWLRRIETPKQWAVVFACAICFSVSLLWLIIYAIGWDLSQINSDHIRADLHYGQSIDHIDAYRWQDEQDRQVGQHVIDARSGLNNSKWLTLVAAKSKEIIAREIDCEKELFSGSTETTMYYSSLMYETTQFMENNNETMCTCGSFFGKHVRHLAISYANTPPEALDDTDSMDEIFKAKKAFHAFNVIDLHAHEYDRLDENAMGEHVAIVQENQNFRYNEARGSFLIVRRTSLQLELLDSMCHKQSIRVFDRLALCVQRCLDMMRGIDTRKRAHMQHAAGIQLNVGVSEQEWAVKDEL